jgi:hypothetical protein
MPPGATAWSAFTLHMTVGNRPIVISAKSRYPHDPLDSVAHDAEKWV